MRLLFEAVPILLAVISLVCSFVRLITTECRQEKYIFSVTTLSALLLILAQSSWAWSVSHNNTVGEFWANNVWTIFNTLAMIAHILYARKT